MNFTRPSRMNLVRLAPHQCVDVWRMASVPVDRFQSSNSCLPFFARVHSYGAPRAVSTFDGTLPVVSEVII